VAGPTRKILVADDDRVTCRLLQARLSSWGFEVQVASDGQEAWRCLVEPDGPRLAILDWMMPGIDGVELCRRLRARGSDPYVYVILLTAKVQSADLAAGFEAGADDYIPKPFQQVELRARLQAGERILGLQQSLADKVRELSMALEHVKHLQGLLPICMHCKKIRNDRNIWERIEAYIEEHSEARFSHALCQECMRKHYPEVSEDLDRRR
jgi:CheY-like chemotaxis protein